MHCERKRNKKEIIASEMLDVFVTWLHHNASLTLVFISIFFIKSCIFFSYSRTGFLEIFNYYTFSNNTQ